MSEQSFDQITEAEQLVAIETARAFIAEEAPHLGRLFNIDGLDISVGSEWVTEVDTNGGVRMQIDPEFFVKRGYEPEWAVYGTLHEIVAHVREALWEPGLTKLVGEFNSQGEAQGIFYNIFSDIAGNKAIHARLPRLEAVAEDVYRRRQMPDDPTPAEDPLEQQTRYKDIPRHLQFLYKIIRQEMIPDSHTIVVTEVDEAIDRLRNYEASGQDVIAYSTNIVKPDGVPTTPAERFGLWQKIIYPEYEKLLEQDRQDPQFDQDQQGDQQSQDQSNEQHGADQGDQQSQSQSNEQESNDQSTEKSQGSDEGGSGQPGDQNGDSDKFKPYYDDYHQNRHPEPLTEEAHEALHEAAEKIAETKHSTSSPRQELSQQVKAETGHSLYEQRSYNQELIKYADQIEEIRELFFNRVVVPQVTICRRLGSTPQTEGAILDPNRLSETIVDIESGVDEPAAFLDYEHRKASAETIGNTDYYLVIDRSSSMAEDDGKKALAAGVSTLIFLEGLAGIQKDIEEAEAEYGVELNVSINSSVYTFGNSAENIKPLSDKLETKERLDSYQAASRPLNEGTADFLALQAIADEPREDEERRRIIIVLTDGESKDTETADRAIRQLRATPNTFVYAISIGSDEAVQLYKPDARRCDNPADLPDTLGKLLEETMS